jgi:hypothetical protein
MLSPFFILVWPMPMLQALRLTTLTCLTSDHFLFIFASIVAFLSLYNRMNVFYYSYSNVIYLINSLYWFVFGVLEDQAVEWADGELSQAAGKPAQGKLTS